MEDILQSLALKQQLDALRPIQKEQEARIMQKFRLDWNYHSNNLEGNSLTYGETKALLFFNITAQGKPLKDHLEVTGHNEAIDWVIEVVKGDYPLTQNFIRQLHTLLLKEPYQVDAQTPDGQPTKKWVQVGRYKTSPNHVQTKTGEMFYFATPEETPAKMSDLLAWYNDKIEDGNLNPILLAAEFHYKFITIHPFDDGNGRTARILMNFILMKYGYPPVIIKTEDKANYFTALQLADTGNLEAFVDYIAKNLLRSLEIMIAGANGESIEEPDDIDKEIALLEKRLNGLGERSNEGISQTSIDFLVDHTVIDIYEAIITKGKKLNSLYLNHKLYLKNKDTSYSKDGLKSELLRVKEFKFEIIYRNFTTTGFGEFNYTLSLNFKIFPTYFSISDESNKLILEKPYQIHLTEHQLEKIVNFETKRHTAFIEQKIADKENGQ